MNTLFAFSQRGYSFSPPKVFGQYHTGTPDLKDVFSPIFDRFNQKPPITPLRKIPTAHSEFKFESESWHTSHTTKILLCLWLSSSSGLLLDLKTTTQVYQDRVGSKRSTVVVRPIKYPSRSPRSKPYKKSRLSQFLFLVAAVSHL